MASESGVESMFPPLPLEEWDESKETLHRYAQIVGKVRLARSPFRNHWWHVPLYVTTRGLTTSPIPDKHITFEISFDLLNNRLVVSTSEGEGFAFAMDDLPVAEFYRRLFDGLGALGMEVSINSKAYGLGDEYTLEENTFNCVCDREYVRRYWRILVQVDQVLKADGLTLVLRKGGKHLEDEPTRGVRGIYWLGIRTKRYSGGLEPVVGVHDHEQRAPQPIELVDEHRVEPACLRVSRAAGSC